MEQGLQVGPLAISVPDHIPESLVFPLDIYHDSRLLPDPHVGWAALRSVAPDIFFTPLNGGHWVVTRHDSILQVLRNTTDFTNRFLDIPRTDEPTQMAPLSFDPPEHTPYRHLLMRFFSIPRVRKMEQHIRDFTNELIDRVIERGECDFAREIAGILPVAVFMELMGLPMDRLEEFRDWADEVFSTNDTDHRNEVYGRIFAFLNGVIEERVAQPQNDLISEIIQSEANGQPMGADGARMFSVLLFIAGMDTVANAMTFGMRHLAQHPELQARIHEDPAVIPNLVEELLRRYPFTSSNRRVVNDIELDGVQMRSGDTMFMCFALAGIDESVFADAERVDPDREDASTHVTFGAGAHKCAGRHLGRLEMRVLYEELARRIKDISLMPDQALHIRAGSVLSMESLKIRFSAR